jgi:hypothetical protein
MLTHRQQIALECPASYPDDHSSNRYKRLVTRGDGKFWTILTLDVFPLSTPMWQAAVAICKGEDFKAVSQWTHNDRCKVIDICKELLAGVGMLG